MITRRQTDKFCPIRKGLCAQDCTFYQSEDSTGDKDYCQISMYMKQYTPNGKSATKKAKPLLEGSDKKV